ncbi:LuxR C-terminal-related transcriptional regulator [Nocardioides sp. WS12]|uniref:LuxR C-terminal-related transcriptional regulator n=1 Tax=Nocardioides sp. WS12 TaxID=2486272 RepID=UPI0015FCAB39|nr:LuxR C-terminal-related transcriptional regulator [Nocardioides sp. WS12]
MSVDLMRPDDVALLRQTSREVRQALRGAVSFGGLSENGRVRVTAVAGASKRLTSIVLSPSRGLGGRSWETGQPLAVDDYENAEDITHDFDDQILGEGIVGLAVAPIIVRRHLRGLLYAGTRSPARASEVLRLLERQAGRVAHELNIRDQVDHRVRLILAAAGGTGQPPVGEQVDPGADALTPRQVDILRLVSLGLKNAEIAAHLGLSVPTVKSYLRTVMARLHASTRQAAVVEARRRGLLP